MPVPDNGQIGRGRAWNATGGVRGGIQVSSSTRNNILILILRSDQSVANWGFMSLARPGARQNLIRAVWNACESIDTLRFLDLTACRLQVAYYGAKL